MKWTVPDTIIPPCKLQLDLCKRLLLVFLRRYSIAMSRFSDNEMERAILSAIEYGRSDIVYAPGYLNAAV
jgi:hypothetical protein